MPRSKLGLNLPVKKLLQKEKFNPTLRLIQLCKSTDEQSRNELKEKGPYLKQLSEYQYSKMKPKESAPEGGGNVKINHLTFTLPSPGSSTVIKEISPDGSDAAV